MDILKNLPRLPADQAGELFETVISVRRVAKVVKGGKRLGFSALVAVGNKAGAVGIGLGNANEVPNAIKQGIDQAKKNLFQVPLRKNTIPHAIYMKMKASKIILKPATPGTGVIAGGAVRVICELAGIKDILSKASGSRNSINIAKATLLALVSLKDLKTVAELRDKKIYEIYTENRAH